MTNRYRVLMAMCTLQQFTVADLARYAEVDPTAARTVVNRERHHLREVTRETKLGRRGRPGQLYEVTQEHLEQLKGELVATEHDARRTAIKVARKWPDSESDVEDIPPTLLSALQILLTEQTEDEREHRSVRRSTAQEAFEDALNTLSIFSPEHHSQSIRTYVAVARFALDLSRAEDDPSSSIGGNIELRSRALDLVERTQSNEDFGLLSALRRRLNVSRVLGSITSPAPSVMLATRLEPDTSDTLQDTINFDLHFPSYDKRLFSPLVGLAEERLQLFDALQEVRESGGSRLHILIGPEGTGKTRLSMESFRQDFVGTRVLTGRCLRYGEDGPGVTFWPLARMISHAAEIGAGDSDQVVLRKLRKLLAKSEDGDAIIDGLAPIVGAIGPMASRRESFWAARKFFGFLASREPLVLCFDDFQWAHPDLSQFISSVVNAGQSQRVLVILISDSIQPTQGFGRLDGITQVSSLDRTECRILIQQLLGDESLEQSTVERLIEYSQGNALHIEQTLEYLADRGAIRRVNGTSWRRIETALKIPRTGSGRLVRRRIQGLPRDLRVTLSYASIMGQVFYREALAELLADPLDVIDDRVYELLSRDFIEHASHSAVPETQAYAFHHSVVYEAASDLLSEKEKGSLHRRFAEWLSSRRLNTAAQGQEFVAFHLEKARQLLIPDVDAIGNDIYREITERAAVALLRAAHQLERTDTRAAATMFERALKYLRENDPRYVQTQIDVSQAYLRLHEYANARETLDKAIKAARDINDDRLLQHVRMLLLRVQLIFHHEERDSQKIDDAVEAAIAVFQQFGDHLGAARAWRTLATVQVTRGAYDDARASLNRALFHVEKSGDHREHRQIRRDRVTLLTWGLLPASEALDKATEELNRSSDDMGLRREAYSQIAISHAMQGHEREARLGLARVTEILADVDYRDVEKSAWFSVFVEGRIHRIERNFEAAERAIRGAVTALEGAAFYRQHYNLSRALLADTLVELGRNGEAKEQLQSLTEAISTEDVAAYVRIAIVQAKIALRQGDRPETVSGFLELFEDNAQRHLHQDTDTRAEIEAVRAELCRREGEHDAYENHRSAAKALYWLRENSRSAAAL